MTPDIVKHNFSRGLWGKQEVAIALKKGVVTKAEHDEIVGGTYQTHADLKAENALLKAKVAQRDAEITKLKKSKS